MIGYIIELTSNLIQTFIMTMFLTMFFGCKYHDNRKVVGFVFAWLLIFVEISFFNQIVLYDSVLSGLSILTFFAYACICLKGKVYMKAFLSTFSMAIVFTIASLVIFVGSCVTGLPTGIVISNAGVLRSVSLLIGRIIEIIIFSLIIHIKNEYILSSKEWFLFMAIPFMVWITIIFLTNATLVAPETTPYMLCSIMIVIAIIVIVYYLMLRINRETTNRTKVELLQMQYDNVKSTEQNMKAIYEHTYSVKHDLEKHLLAIKTISTSEGEGKVTEYINNLLNKDLNTVQQIIFTQNDVFNAVMNTRLEICKHKNIITSLNISDAVLTYIKDEHVAILFGNIFDNAIEAAEQTNKKFILLNVQQQGNYISIYMENSFNKQFSDVELNTTKIDKSVHGFGMKNVERIVEEYNGMMKCFKNEAGMFCCDILLCILK